MTARQQVLAALLEHGFRAKECPSCRQGAVLRVDSLPAGRGARVRCDGDGCDSADIMRAIDLDPAVLDPGGQRQHPIVETPKKVPAAVATGAQHPQRGAARSLVDATPPPTPPKRLGVVKRDKQEDWLAGRRGGPAPDWVGGSSPGPDQPEQPDPSDYVRTLDDLRKIPPIPREPVIGNLLREGGVGQLVGAPGAGKTWVALWWAIAKATGAAILGEPVEPGKVLFVSGEVEADEYLERVDAILDHPKRGELLPGADLALLDTNLALVEPDYFDTFGTLDTWDAWDRLYGAFCGAVTHLPKLLMIDPQADVFGLADENDNETMQRKYGHLRRLVRMLGSAAIVCHHTGHQKPGDKERTFGGRGASAQAGTVNFYAQVGEKNGVPCVEVKKVRRGHKPDAPTFFTLDPDNGVPVPRDAPLDATARGQDTRTKLTTVLKAYQPLTLEDAARRGFEELHLHGDPDPDTGESRPLTRNRVRDQFKALGCKAWKAKGKRGHFWALPGWDPEQQGLDLDRVPDPKGSQ